MLEWAAQQPHSPSLRNVAGLEKLRTVQLTDNLVEREYALREMLRQRAEQAGLAVQVGEQMPRTQDSRGECFGKTWWEGGCPRASTGAAPSMGIWSDRSMVSDGSLPPRSARSN